MHPSMRNHKQDDQSLIANLAGGCSTGLRQETLSSLIRRTPALEASNDVHAAFAEAQACA